MRIGRKIERLVVPGEVYSGWLVSDRAEEKYGGLAAFVRYDRRRTVEYIVREEKRRRRGNI